MDKRLWLVGFLRNPDTAPDEWEFQGIFDSADKARAACTRPYNFFYPVTLNLRLPDEIVETLEYEFPMLTEAPHVGE